MSFKILSWNVEAFKGSSERLPRVVDHIKTDEPDVIGLFEVENMDIIDLVDNYFPGYNFHLTQGSQNKEILVGYRKDKFETVIFTQKREFKVYNPFLRPGALLTVKYLGKLYNILFLHTDSGTEAADFGNRQEMFDKIWRLKKTLNVIGKSENAPFIVLGDLNTMGLNFPTRRKSDQRVSAIDEIVTLDSVGSKTGMTVLPKNEPETFNNLRLQSNLDHVVASTSILFAAVGKDVANNPQFVSVRGWNQLSGNDRKDFIDHISDHSSLTVTVLE